MKKDIIDNNKRINPGELQVNDFFVCFYECVDTVIKQTVFSKEHPILDEFGKFGTSFYFSTDENGKKIGLINFLNYNGKYIFVSPDSDVSFFRLLNEFIYECKKKNATPMKVECRAYTDAYLKSLDKNYREYIDPSNCDRWAMVVESDDWKLYIEEPHIKPLDISLFK